MLMFVIVAASCTHSPNVTDPPTAATATVATVADPPAPGTSDDPGTSASAGTTAPAATSVDVIVAGDGLGAVGAAVQAGRRGHKVVLFSPLGYVGGQAGSAGVTSFDDASGPARDMFRTSGLYAELFTAITQHYDDLGLSTSTCYFSDINTFCPEPHVVREHLEAMLSDAGVEVTVDRVADVTFTDDGGVNGVLTASGHAYRGLVIDGTEFGDLIPLAEAAYGIGNEGAGACVQDMTHAVVMAWYPDVPAELEVPSDANELIAATAGAETVREWLADFRAMVAPGGQAEFIGWGELTYPIDSSLAVWYRGMPDSRVPDPDRPAISVSGINFPNDTAVPAAAVEGGPARLDAFREATLKTYLYMWYDRWELGRDQWAVATHLGFAGTERQVWLDEIPDEIERHMPPGYYIREGRRLTGADPMAGADIVERGIDVYPDSVLIGGDRSDDDHGSCGITDSVLNPTLGPYDAPLRVFIPDDVDGFLVAIARNGNVDRSVASSIRMHAPELLGGQAVGMLAALAVEAGFEPREIPVATVRTALIDQGAVIDVPS